MKDILEKLPKLIKREHMLKDIGISDSLYYKLIREKQLPIVRIGNRIYINKDKLAKLLESGLLTVTADEKEGGL